MPIRIGQISGYSLRINEYDRSFFGAFITDLLGKSSDAGHLGKDFAMLGGIVLVALVIQLYFLRPKANDFVDANSPLI